MKFFRQTGGEPMRRVLALLLFVLVLTACAGQQPAAPSTDMATQTFDAVVRTVTREESSETEQGNAVREIVLVEITEETRRGEQFELDSSTIYLPNTRPLAAGDAVVLEISTDPDGNEFAYISDYVRRTPLLLLFGLFIAATLVVARKRGLASLFGMGISFVVIFQFVIPQILAGTDPLLTVILGAGVIIPVTFYLSHGLNRKTTAAIIGTLVALCLTGILASVSIELLRLSGMGMEETMFLAQASAQPFNFQGLLLAGIIISLLGILDDITVSQAAIVWQLKQAQPAMRFAELYRRTMDVGNDHIASLVNTLVLVYAGASLPLLLLFGSNAVSLGDVINYEIIAEEIVRMLVGSIGLILAVPITTLLAALWLSRERQTSAAGPSLLSEGK